MLGLFGITFSRGKRTHITIGNARLERFVFDDGSVLIDGPGGHAAGPNKDRLKYQDQWYCKTKDIKRAGFYTDDIYEVYRHCSGMK